MSKVLAGPSIDIPQRGLCYIDEVLSIVQETHYPAMDNSWKLSFKDGVVRVSTEDLEARVPGLMAIYMAERSSVNKEMTIVEATKLRWLQQYYLTHFHFTPANPVFKLWHLIDIRCPTNMAVVEERAMAQLYPALAIGLELGADPAQQLCVLETYRQENLAQHSLSGALPPDISL